MPGSGEWSNGEELGQTWESRNAFSYGASKTGEKGVKRTDLLRGLLNTTDRIIQEVYNSHAHLGFIYTRITIHTYVHYIYIYAATQGGLCGVRSNGYPRVLCEYRGD